MGLLSGSISVIRCNVVRMPEELDFEAAPFRAIQPGSQVTERIGFVPFEPDAPYQIGQHQWAFRVRIDRLRPDPTAVNERLKELVKSERDATGAPYVGAARRRKLRTLAQEELLATASPRSRLIECCIDGTTLTVGTTANASIGLVLALLREIEVICDFKAPWLDDNETQVHSTMVDAGESWQSILGCRFLRALLEDPDILLEPESGHVRLQTRDATVSLSGAVLNDLHRLLEAGAELLSAKLVTGSSSFRFDALNYRLTGLRVETEPHDGWIENLDARLSEIAEVWDLLDGKYRALSPKLHSETFAR